MEKKRLNFGKRFWSDIKNHLVLVLPLLLASLVFLNIVPLGQTPDEPTHISYIKYVANNYRLPTLKDLETAHQPPAYYLLLSLVYRLSNNLPSLRLFSIIFSLLNVIVIYKYISLLFPRKTAIAKGTALFSSLIPMYGFMSIAINNDSLSNLLASLIIYFSLIGASRQLKANEFCLWCLLLLVSAFTKIVLFPIIFISLGIFFWKQKNKRGWILLFLIFLFLSLYFLWFSRNVRLYGNNDIFGWQMLKKVYPTLNDSGLIRNNPRQWLVLVFHSFWGIFGQFAIYLPVKVYSVLRRVTLFLSIFFVWQMVRFWKKAGLSRKTNLLLLFLFFFTVLGAVIFDNLSFFHPQGRYLFPVVGIASLYYSFSIYGLSLLVSKIIGKQFQKLIYYSLILVPLVYINLISLATINNFF